MVSSCLCFPDISFPILLNSLVFIGEISSETEIKYQTFHNQMFLDVLSRQSPVRESKIRKCHFGMPYWGMCPSTLASWVQRHKFKFDHHSMYVPVKLSGILYIWLEKFSRYPDLGRQIGTPDLMVGRKYCKSRGKSCDSDSISTGGQGPLFKKI